MNNYKTLGVLFLSLMFFTACTPGNSRSTSKLFPNTYKMSGPSMRPTINEGEYMVIDPAAALNRGDMIIFTVPVNEQDLWVKRIIGLPGETVELKNGSVIINSVRLEESYLTDDMKQKTLPHGARDSFVIPDGGYFVLGDNRVMSTDSRSCFVSARENQDCIDGKIPFSVTKAEIKGVITNHSPDLPDPKFNN